MPDSHRLVSFLRIALEANSSRCLDNEADREAVAEDLFKRLRKEYMIARRHPDLSMKDDY